MRLHYSFQVVVLLRNLGDAGAPLRRAIVALLKDPRVQEARAIPERPGRYELFESGYWIVYEYEIDDSGMETVIRVAFIDEP
jgi:hypothetical protein